MKKNTEQVSCDHVKHLEDTIYSMRARIQLLEGKLGKFRSRESSTTLQNWVSQPIFEIDLRDFMPGDKIEFLDAPLGYSKFVIFHKEI